MSQLINSNYFLNNDIKEIKKSNDEVIKELSNIKFSEETINKTLNDLKSSGSSVDFAPVFKKINDIEQSIINNNNKLQSEINTINKNIISNIDDIKKLKNLAEKTGFNYQIYFTDTKRKLSELINNQPTFKSKKGFTIPFLAPKNDIDELIKLGHINIFIRGYQDIDSFHYVLGSKGWFPDNSFNYTQYDPKMIQVDLSKDFKISFYINNKFELVFNREKKEFYINFFVYPPFLGMGEYRCVLPKNIIFSKV